jgi:hypothetical protein
MRQLHPNRPENSVHEEESVACYFPLALTVNADSRHTLNLAPADWQLFFAGNKSVPAFAQKF